MNAIKYDHDQGNRHNDTLDQVGGRYRQETAHNGIADNDDRTDDHGHVVIHAKQAGEQGAYGLKSGSRIRDKENQDDDGRDAHQDVLLIMKSSGEEIRNSDGIADNGIAAKPLCHNQPV